MTSNPESGLDNSIALRFDEGVSYGAVVWIKKTDIQIQSSARLQKGAVVEFRMELNGQGLAPYGLLLILEANPGNLQSGPTLRCSFLRMEEKDLLALNAWVAQKEQRIYTGSTSAQLDLSDTAHQALHAPEATAARQRYQQNKGRLQPTPDILRSPFASSEKEGRQSDSVSVPSISTEDPDFPPPAPAQQQQANAYLKSMSKRGKARERRPHPVPPPPEALKKAPPSTDDDWELPPPPPAALKKAPPSTDNDWELPPPPPAALKKASPSTDDDWELPPPPPAALKKSPPSTDDDWELPPPPPAALKKSPPSTDDDWELPNEPNSALGNSDLTISIDGSTLTVQWASTEGYMEALAGLQQGLLLVPQTLQSIERLSLVLPDQTRLALRVKTLEPQETGTKVCFRINPVLSSKLDAALK